MFKIVRKTDNRDLIARLLRENFSRHRRGYAIAIGAMLIVATTTALSAWIMESITDNLFIDGQMSRVYLIAGFVALIFIVKGLAVFVQTYTLGRVGNSIVANQQRIIYDKMLKHGLEFFHANQSSELITRISHNAQAVRDVLNMLVTSFARDLFSLIGLVAVMVYQQPRLSLIAFTVAPIAIFGVNKLIKRVRVQSEKGFASTARIIQVMKETITGIRIVKSFNLEDRLRKTMDAAVSDLQKRADRIALLGAGTSPIMETLGGLAIALAVIVGGVLVIQQGQSPGKLMSFITALLLAYEPAKRLARLQIQLEAGLVGVRMMFELSDRAVTVTQAADANDLNVTDGRVTFQSVEFGYHEAQSVLNDLQLELRPGQMTALVGPSGGGKSTVMNLLLRLYDPDSGAIKIDGQNIRHATFHSLRSNVAFVSQDTFLFEGSVRENIEMGKAGATEADIIEAAKAANAHEFVSKLPNGYDTNVGENGAELSGGQKQRIAIARALLKDAPIVLLDEATSALDSESEAKVKSALEVLLNGRTSLVIAHRLSTVTNADQICVMKAGQVVETGSHDQLLKNGQHYADLHRIQFAS